jgi:PAS domain S-box-containing protein
MQDMLGGMATIDGCWVLAVLTAGTIVLLFWANRWLGAIHPGARMPKAAWAGAMIAIAVFGVYLFSPNAPEIAGVVVESILLAIALVATASVAAVLAAGARHRKRAQEDLLQSERRLKLTVEQLPLAYVEWTTEAEVVGWNPAAERVFGFAREEVLGKKIFGLIIPPEVRPQVDEVWKRLLANTGGFHSINENLRKDGKRITCEWNNTAFVDAAGKVVGVMSLSQDITDRVQLEAQVQQAQKLQSIGQLAAGVAHDFNNILTIIQGHTDLLLNRRDMPPDAVEEIDRVATAASRAANLTRQLLTFSRKQVMFARPLDLNEVVATTTTMLSRILGDDVALHCELAHDLPGVRADPGMIEQAIMNLALNSRDAMPRGGRLTISTRCVEIDAEVARNAPDTREGPAVCLALEDTGCGIPPDKLALVFEPFYTTKEVGAGTGLGLAAVHGIVRQHAGWIRVESSVGHGTCVSLYFPAIPAAEREAPVEEPKAAPDPAPGAPSATILVVEDEVAVRKLACMVLEREGFTVLEAEDGVDAERVWEKDGARVDLLLTDIVMPNGINGCDLARRLLKLRPELKVIYASGYSVEIAGPDFGRSERAVFLPKPYLPRQLISTVRKRLAEAD